MLKFCGGMKSSRKTYGFAGNPGNPPINFLLIYRRGGADLKPPLAVIVNQLKNQ